MRAPWPVAHEAGGELRVAVPRIYFPSPAADGGASGGIHGRQHTGFGALLQTYDPHA